MSKMDIIVQDGFGYAFLPHACRACGHRCCRGASGNIWVDPQQVSRICRFLGINIIDGLAAYFIKRQNRFSIRESHLENDHACIFLDLHAGCTIYPVRPPQCRSFPFWPHFKTDMSRLRRECPGVVPVDFKP